MTLRTARLDELGTIHALRRAAILGVPSETGLRERQAWADKRSPEFFADRLAAGTVVIARWEDEALGWGSSADEWITGLYIAPSWSRRGVGRTLMARLEAAIVMRRHACARLEASPTAVGFYTKLGYVPVGLPDGDGAVPMKKRLRTAEAPSRAG